MPVTDPVDALEGSLADFPAFDLACTVDDEAEPRRVTVHSTDEEELVTHWITVDADCTVDLDEMR